MAALLAALPAGASSARSVAACSGVRRGAAPANLRNVLSATGLSRQRARADSAAVPGLACCGMDLVGTWDSQYRSILVPPGGGSPSPVRTRVRLCGCVADGDVLSAGATSGPCVAMETLRRCRRTVKRRFPCPATTFGMLCHCYDNGIRISGRPIATSLAVTGLSGKSVLCPRHGVAHPSRLSEPRHRPSAALANRGQPDLGQREDDRPPGARG